MSSFNRETAYEDSYKKHTFKKHSTRNKKYFDFDEESEQKNKKRSIKQTTKWMLGDSFHREDGPAIEWPNGINFWYFHGKLYKKQE